MEMCKLCQDKYHRLEKQDKPIDDLEIFRAAVAIFAASNTIEAPTAVELAKLIADEVRVRSK